MGYSSGHAGNSWGLTARVRTEYESGVWRPCRGRWVYEQLWGPSSDYRGEEQRLVDYGRLEVDGPPPDGRERWGRHDLQGGITDLTGHR